MGGEDKGLIPLGGRPLAQHALERITPQVGRVLINANRNRDAYARLGHAVFGDQLAGFQGPLAGVAAALARIDTPLLLTLPCDSPLLPADLAARLYCELESAGADLAVAHDGRRMHPVFALLRRERLPSLLTYLAGGDRKVELWLDHQHSVAVDFADEAEAFRNVNAPEERAELERLLRDRR